MTEESFGPILAVAPVDDDDHVLIQFLFIFFFFFLIFFPNFCFFFIDKTKHRLSKKLMIVVMVLPLRSLLLLAKELSVWPQGFLFFSFFLFFGFEILKLIYFSLIVV